MLQTECENKGEVIKFVAERRLAGELEGLICFRENGVY
jgi:hypothetical protein